MRMAEIVQLLQQQLPGKTDLLHDIVPVSSITATADTATVVTSADHNLATGNVVALAGVETRIPITAVDQSGLQYTFTTSADHDLTENNPDTATVVFAGFTDPLWNLAHELVRVDNSRTFTVKTSIAAPVLNGNELLLEPNRIDGVNGVFAVTVIDPTTFTISGSFIAGTYTPIGGKVVSNPRIFTSPTLERAEELYHSDPSKFWAFVVPGIATVSKDRATESDAVAAFMSGHDVRLRLLDEFSVFVFSPTADELAAEKAMDICRHELLGPIVSSIYGARLDSGLACGTSEFRITLTGHGIADFKRAYLIHEFAFEAPADLTGDDAVRIEGDRAFRDIDYTMLGPHTPLTVSADLDKEPLP